MRLSWDAAASSILLFQITHIIYLYIYVDPLLLLTVVNNCCANSTKSITICFGCWHHHNYQPTSYIPEAQTACSLIQINARQQHTIQPPICHLSLSKPLTECSKISCIVLQVDVVFSETVALDIISTPRCQVSNGHCVCHSLRKQQCGSPLTLELDIHVTQRRTILFLRRRFAIKYPLRNCSTKIHLTSFVPVWWHGSCLFRFENW